MSDAQMPDPVPPLPTEAPQEHSLVTEPGTEDVGRQVFLDQIREVADKLTADKATRGDIKIIARSAKELRYAFKVFTPYRRRMKVTVFGSARTPKTHPDYEAAVEFGRQMKDSGWMVVTGAGGGIMEGANEGAGRAESMGVNIMLPFEQEANPVIRGDQKLVTFRYFFTRKLMFVKEVHGVAVFPGGFGTHDELFEIITLIQTGKRDLMPVVLVDRPGSTYWADWLEFVKKQLLGRGLISPSDLSLFKVMSSVDDAVSEIQGFYRVYHSMRYVRNQLILRLDGRLTPEVLAYLNKEYADLLVSGRIEEAAPHPFEADEPHLNDLFRLSLHFNRRDAGRLRQMIDYLNARLTPEFCVIPN